LTVDYLFRGVIVAPGKRRVEWTYVAPGFRFGVALSLAGLIVLAGLSAWPERRAI
jgi:uncharacterized membrane protein YfhO